MSSSEVHTYHCICSELVIATFAPLQKLPKRQGDGAAICKTTNSDLPVPGGFLLSGSTFDGGSPIVMKLEDGFEKRYSVQCGRCDLQIGYRLDKSQFEEKEKGIRSDVMYILAGSLLSTEEMKDGKSLEKETENGEGTAG